MITRKMIFDGCYKGFVRLIESPHGDGVVCQIGDVWFYFGGLTAEECSTVEEYKMQVDTKTFLDEIYSVLNNFKDSGEELKDEYLYYEYYLKEKGIKEMKNVKELTRDQLNELKQAYATQIKEDSDMSYEELSNATNIPDDVIFEHYEGITFSNDDFFCTANNKEEGLTMKLTTRIMQIIEEHGFSIEEVTKQEDDYYVGLNQRTPAGEDWYLIIWFNGTTEDFILQLKIYYNNFDIDEEVEPYISMRGKNGVPNSISILLEDAEWKETKIKELSDDLSNYLSSGYSKEYILKDTFKINDIIIAKKGDVIIIEDANPSENETLDDVDGYCDIENITASHRFNATYLDVDYSILQENIREEE